MPSPLPGSVGSVMKLSAVSSLFGQNVVTTHHFQITVAATGPDPLQTFADDFYLGYSATILSIQGSDLTLNRIECHLIVNPADPAQRRDSVSATAGGSTPPSAPPAVACVIRKRTPFIGRKYRGRFYIPGIPAAAIDGGSITSTFTASIQTAAESLYDMGWLTTDPTMAAKPVLLGKDAENTAAYPIGKRVTEIVSVDMDVILRQQRRREIGVGS